jgi:predicted RNA binding protein YcfA (HicA-like mRNA interferase family)
LNRSAKELIKPLESKGSLFKRSKGSHQIYYNSSTNKTVVVPLHGNKDMPKGTYYAILKQAGLDKGTVE